MPAIAFLSTDHLEDYFVYDELLIPFFNDNGWSVETISWHSQSENWDRFDYVIVRSTWDYQQHAEAFLACLTQIDASSATLLNPLPLMQWNIEKHYLKDLQEKGVPIVSTRWSSAFNNSVIDEAFSPISIATLWWLNLRLALMLMIRLSSRSQIGMNSNRRFLIRLINVIS